MATAAERCDSLRGLLESSGRPGEKASMDVFLEAGQMRALRQAGLLSARSCGGGGGQGSRSSE